MSFVFSSLLWQLGSVMQRDAAGWGEPCRQGRAESELWSVRCWSEGLGVTGLEVF